MINKIKNLISEIETNIVILLAMVYVTCKLTCNPLFFRQINFSFDLLHLNLKIVSSSLVFPVIYIISDLISAITNRTTAIFIVLVGILCDGVFSFIINFVSNLPLPTGMSAGQFANTNAVNVIGLQIWSLFEHGILATIVANIAEILIFAKIFRKIKNFFISTVISVFVILIFHNTLTDYPMLKTQTGAWQIIFNGLWINMTIMIIYAALFSGLIWIRKQSTILINK